ncbi:Phosphate acyltransferase [BD1-7 clade bacterium]|uniref:Phosphate acyltransferase n=1 Tax=BD1-7 clade bacterium TaxID=2029982 RepID=A0A5S9QDZ3_9GAMM|nr:Phosphate acyltransferase [BD1-7 clade bacterium]CAA0116006.1 Phosphate acyltransferase [BD1-7 clade bacterium]
MVTNTVAIDAMSGDFGPRVIIPSTLQYLQGNPGTRVVFVGKTDAIEPLVNRRFAHRVDVVHASEVIGMDEVPSQALRHKKDSSIHVAVDLVKNGLASACLSAGNTGALMGVSKIKLRTIDGVDRPAICGAVPSLESHSYLLDMGANVDCSAEHLLQFAIMASVMARALDGKVSPTVALLNNGEEDTKGNHQVKEASELLAAKECLNYIGFIEGHRIFEAVADIIVCDGFVGNIALKASEGVATYIMDKIRKEIKSDPVTRLLSWFAIPEFRRVSSKVDPRRLNGAVLLGLKGVVVKSHGHADQLAFGYALEHAYRMLSVDIVSQLDQEFQSLV